MRRVTLRGALVAIVCAFAAMGASPSGAGAAEAPFGIESFTASLSNREAGGHPDLTTFLRFDVDPESPIGPAGFHEPAGTPEAVAFELPPGLVGDPTTIPACSRADFEERQTSCSQDSQVGIATLRIASFNSDETTPIFELQPSSPDEVAELGFHVQEAPVIVSVVLRSNGDYGLTAVARGLPTVRRLLYITTTIWGVPEAESHDTERLTEMEGGEGKTASPLRPSGIPPAPFLVNPTRCGDLGITVRATPYGNPERAVTRTDDLGTIEGCEGLSFGPSLSLRATTRAAASPSGLDAELTMPQDESVGGHATAELRTASVVLPPGIAISPTAAEGLEGCTAEQVGLGTLEPARCPTASKIGSVIVDVPALASPLHGALYQRTPDPGRLLGVWLVTDELGVHLKIPGVVQADALTSQVSAVFDGTPESGGNPQVPIRSFRMHFKEGPQGVLSTPRSCGTVVAQYNLVPWSRATGVAGSEPMTFDQGCGTGGFSPGLVAGTVSPDAGAYSPLVTTVTRNDGEGNLRTIELTLPPGALAKLAGVPPCPDVAAASGACGAASRVGSVTVAAGTGPSPLWIPQPGKSPTAVYLAGPYKGAPYSLVIDVPAQAGPFDLGQVVTRAGIYVDPETAQVTVRSDPLPQILEGIPISYRTIAVDIDRPQFTLNPTSCRPMAIGGQATSDTGQVGRFSDPFQVAGCAALPFAPKLTLQLKGATGRTGRPALKAIVTYPKPGQANIARAQVNLPAGELLDQGNLDRTCTKPVLLAGKCPPSTVYGRVRAFTPLLDRPLEGNVYLVGGYGYKLPALVAELDGQIRVLLIGKVDSGRNKGIRNTFELVPDAPVSRFELRLKGGSKYGLLENSEDLCKAPPSRRRANATFVGQNGKVDISRPVVRNRCRKTRSGS